MRSARAAIIKLRDENKALRTRLEEAEELLRETLIVLENVSPKGGG